MNSEFREALKKAGVDFDNTLEKRLMGSEELYQKCLFMFADNENVVGYKNAIAEKNYDEAFDNIHALKGTAANVGIIKIVDPREMSTMPTFEERLGLLEQNSDRGAIDHLEIVNEALRFKRYTDPSFGEWSDKFISECEAVISLINSFRDR